MPPIKAPLFGILGSLHLIVTIEDEPQQEQADEFLYRYAREHRKTIEREIRRAVSETLGPEYEMVALHFTQGSLDVNFWLVTAGTIYVTVSQYDDFLKGVARLSNQLRRILEEVFGNAAPGLPGIDVSVSGSWRPSEALSEAHRFLMTTRSTNLNLLFTIYLMSSNAVLLAAFIWLLLRHSK